MVKLQHSGLLVLTLSISGIVFSQDKFADIGTRGYEKRDSLLVVPQPPVLPDISLDVTNNSSAVFKPVKSL